MRDPVQSNIVAALEIDEKESSAELQQLFDIVNRSVSAREVQPGSCLRFSSGAVLDRAGHVGNISFR